MPEHILIADDYDQFRRLMRLTLEHAGYRVTDVRDGEAADAALADGEFAAAVLDNQMPGMTGAEVIAAARSRGDLTPLLLVSGSITMNDLPDGLPSVYLLPKPFPMTDLVATVNQLVGRQPPAPAPRRWFRIHTPF